MSDPTSPSTTDVTSTVDENSTAISQLVTVLGKGSTALIDFTSKVSESDFALANLGKQWVNLSARIAQGGDLIKKITNKIKKKFNYQKKIKKKKKKFKKKNLIKNIIHVFILSST